MNRILTRGAAIAALALALGGCQGLGQFLAQPTVGAGGKPSTLGADVLSDWRGCYRTAQGALGVGVTGGFQIVCLPVIPEGSKIIPLSQLGLPPAAPVPAGSVVQPPPTAPASAGGQPPT